MPTDFLNELFLQAAWPGKCSTRWIKPGIWPGSDTVCSFRSEYLALDVGIGGMNVGKEMEGRCVHALPAMFPSALCGREGGDSSALSLPSALRLLSAGPWDVSESRKPCSHIHAEETRRRHEQHHREPGHQGAPCGGGGGGCRGAHWPQRHRWVDTNVFSSHVLPGFNNVLASRLQPQGFCQAQHRPWFRARRLLMLELLKSSPSCVTLSLSSLE